MLSIKKLLILVGVLSNISLVKAQDFIEITHFDIGQGDATLISAYDSLGNSTNVLFDAGGYSRISGEDAGLIIHQYLCAKRIDTLHYLVVSHYDADHIGGIVNAGWQGMYETSLVVGPDEIPDTEDDIIVLNVIDRGNDSPPSSTIFEKYVSFADTHNRYSVDSDLRLGYVIPLGDSANMTCIAANGFVMGHTEVISDVNTENERSLSFLLRFKGFDYLISGDLIGRASGNEDAKIEEALGRFIYESNWNIDVLHVNHHGANNTSDSVFLSYIEPEYAIISCGKDNSHGHPRVESLYRLIQCGVITIFQTNAGSDGMYPQDILSHQKIYDNHIIISTDGHAYNISSFNNNPKLNVNANVDH